MEKESVALAEVKADQVCNAKRDTTHDEAARAEERKHSEHAVQGKYLEADAPLHGRARQCKADRIGVRFVIALYVSHQQHPKSRQRV